MDKKQLLSECLSELSASRVKAQNEAVKNLMKARQIKGYSNLERQERMLTFDIGKQNANGEDTSSLEKDLKLIQEKKQHLLIKNGINPDSLVPNYSCKECEDTGYKQGSMCNCLAMKMHEKLMKSCGVENQKLSTFEEFKNNITTNKEHQIQLDKLKIKFEKIANTFPENHPKFIILSGKTGVGKTFMAECLANRLLERGFMVSFVSAFGMNNILLSYHTCFNDQKQSYLNALIDPDVLVVDDLGTEPILKNVTLEYLYLILSERSRLNKLTLITTNLDMQGILDRYNERIFSRLVNKRESFKTQIDGSDLRLKQ